MKTRLQNALKRFSPLWLNQQIRSFHHQKLVKNLAARPQINWNQSQPMKTFSTQSYFRKWIGIEELKENIEKAKDEVKQTIENENKAIGEIQDDLKMTAKEIKIESEKMKNVVTDMTNTNSQIQKNANLVISEIKGVEKVVLNKLHTEIKKIEDQLIALSPNKKNDTSIVASLIFSLNNLFKKIKEQSWNLSFLLAATLIILEMIEYIKSEEKTSRVDPSYRQKTHIGEELLNKLDKLSEEENLFSDNNELPQKKYKKGIYGVVLVGAPGMGKTEGLNDLDSLLAHNFTVTHYFTSLENPCPSLLLNCTTEIEFKNQLIDQAKKRGMKQKEGYDINYTEAMRFLKQHLEMHPGWLIAFDQVDTANLGLIEQFLKELNNSGSQSGRVVIAARYLDKADLDQCSSVVWHPQFLNLNERHYGFNEEIAFNFLEILTQSLYKDESLTYVQSLFKKTELLKKLYPGFPHTDEALKKELVKQVGYSPLAIYVASMYLVAEYVKTKKSPHLLLSNYLDDLSKQLGTRQNQSIFDTSLCLEVTDKEMLQDRNKLYDRVNQAVYALAFTRLDELSKADSLIEAAKLYALPFCISIDPRHLHQHYFDVYLKDYLKKKELSSTDLTTVIDVLCQYGLLKHYMLPKNKAMARDHREFFAEYALRDAYLNYEAKKMSYENIALNKNEKAESVDGTAVTKKEESADKLKAEIEEKLVLKAMEFFSKQFHLNSTYLASIGLNWQFAAHYFFLLKLYQKFHQPLASSNLIDILKFVNPILNILVQGCFLKELELINQEAKSFLHLLPVQQPKADQNRKFNPQEVKTFCENLRTINPALPTLYAQFIYYPARIIFKTDMDSGRKKECNEAIKLADAMRTVIDANSNNQYTKSVSGMDYDGITFKRDGIGLIYLEEDLQQAKSHYETIINYIDPKTQKIDLHNQSACHRFLALIDIRLARKESDDIKANALLVEAENKLNQSEKDAKGLSLLQRRYAKSGRYYLVRAELYEVKAEKDKVNSLNHLEEAANSYIKSINEGSFDRLNDEGQSYLGLSRVYQKIILLNGRKSMEEKEILFRKTLDAVNHSIERFEKIKLIKMDNYLQSAYSLKEQLTTQRNHLFSLFYAVFGLLRMKDRSAANISDNDVQLSVKNCSPPQIK